MLVIIVRVAYFIVCASAIVTFVLREGALLPEGVKMPPFVADHQILVSAILLLLTQIPTVIDLLLKRKRLEIVSALYFGVLVGFLVSYLTLLAIQPVFVALDVGGFFVLITKTFVSLAVTYISVSLLLQTKDDFRFVIPYVEFSRELKGQASWILDSSALIDGRIADIVDTNIVDAPMIVPQFVLHEVQDIADSNDKMRRTRGRRGLEVLSKLQNNPKVEIRMHDTDREAQQGMSVDQRLVEVAKELGGHVVTNDFNLNKVASVQGIGVINMNDLANALKPRYLPGERLRIKILKEGESQGQGVGYLDDGTMVVCEQADRLVGKDIDVIVTSVLQSSAGRMIFGRQVHATNS